MPRPLRVVLLGVGLAAFVLALAEGALRALGLDLYPRTSVLDYQEVFPPVLRGDRTPAGTAILRPIDPRIPFAALPARKEPGALRVLFFGASAAAGLGHSPNVTFARQLEDLLVEGYPGREVEVMNLGVIAIAAKQVRVLLEDALRYAAPDAVVVWCGSNEYLSVHAEKYARFESAWHARLLQRLARTYVYRGMLRAVHGPPSIADLPGRGDVMSDDERLTQARIIRHIAVTQEDRDRTMASFQRELEGMAAAARAAGVPIVLCGEAVNDEWVGREGLPEGWMAALPGAPTTPEAAIAVLDEVLAREDLGALERWQALVRRATARDLAGDTAGANADWRTSCNVDPHQRRSTDAHLAAVRAAAVGEGVAYLDGPAVVRADDPRGRSGFGHFYDYTHVNPRGAAVIAAAIYEALQELPGVPRATAPLARSADGLPAVLTARLARIAAAAVDFADAREFVGFCFDPAAIASTDLWKYDDAVLALDARIAADPADWRARAFRGNARSYLCAPGLGDQAAADWEAALAACDEAAGRAALEGNLARLRAVRAPGH